MFILSKKILLPIISLTSVGGICLTTSLLSSGKGKISLKDKFQNQNTGRILINKDGHDRVWRALLKEYIDSPDKDLPIPKSQITVGKMKELCSSLEKSTEEGKLFQYEKYCTRNTWKGSIAGLIEVEDTVKWTKQKERYKNVNSAPIVALNGDIEKLSEWCESKYQEPYEDKEVDSDYWQLQNWCVWESELSLQNENQANSA